MKRFALLAFLVAAFVLTHGCADRAGLVANIDEISRNVSIDPGNIPLDPPDDLPSDLPTPIATPTATPTPTLTPTSTPTPTPTPPDDDRDLVVEFPKGTIAPNLATTLTYHIVLRGGSKPENVKLSIDRSSIDAILDNFMMKDQVKITLSATDVDVAKDEVKNVEVKVELLRTDLPAFQTGKLIFKAIVGNKSYMQQDDFWIQPIVSLELINNQYYLNTVPVTELQLRKLYSNLTDVHDISIIVSVSNSFSGAFEVDNAVVNNIYGPFGTNPVHFQFFVSKYSNLGDGFLRLMSDPNVSLVVRHIQ